MNFQEFILLALIFKFSNINDFKMKKVFFMALGMGMLVSLVGCKKEYSCECKTDFGFLASDSTITYTYESAKRKDAEDACAAAETGFKTADASATCTLR